MEYEYSHTLGFTFTLNCLCAKYSTGREIFMFKPIMEYFKLKKLYKDSKKVLMVNAAETISSIKNITAILEQLLEAEKEG